ncbi:hypothetical protein mRhiFer1_009777 [Rhinolophus ferrumequinum]|uniref:Uncharacterized protein n=1 Tax=Rhinolophus ferrumequinum TaxID=59479 RepID=A0A7J7ZEB8_RHIFE|nr:hypothetical protein mRhiFer1_009777 [Rhinolophus ferrumequinum]
MYKIIESGGGRSEQPGMRAPTTKERKGKAGRGARPRFSVAAFLQKRLCLRAPEPELSDPAIPVPFFSQPKEPLPYEAKLVPLLRAAREVQSDTSLAAPLWGQRLTDWQSSEPELRDGGTDSGDPQDRGNPVLPCPESVP